MTSPRKPARDLTRRKFLAALDDATGEVLAALAGVEAAVRDLTAAVRDPTSPTDPERRRKQT